MSLYTIMGLFFKQMNICLLIGNIFDYVSIMRSNYAYGINYNIDTMVLFNNVFLLATNLLLLTFLFKTGMFTQG